MSDQDKEAAESVVEWVTVAEAAHRLGILERTAHRWAAKMTDNDRQVTDTGKRLVRLSAMAERSKQAVSTAKDSHYVSPFVPVTDRRQTDDRQSATNDGQVTDIDSHLGSDDRQKTDTVTVIPAVDLGPLLAEKDARIADLQESLHRDGERHEREVERLGKALDQAQQLHLASMAEIQKLRADAERLAEENRRLIVHVEHEPEAPPVQPPAEPETGATVNQNAAPTASRAPQGDDREPARVETPPDALQGQKTGKGFWNRLFRIGKGT